MSEAEKQEGQKTVVAFITGLLIGGLLVWVFSSSPEKAVPVTGGDDTGAVKTNEVKVEDTNTTKTDTTTKSTDNKQTEQIGEGSISVADQAAGAVVSLGEMKYPTKIGWIVVRDYMDGIPGNVLGAARYGVDEGLTPSSINLLRNTVAESSYQVAFYTDNGDKVFDLTDDKNIDSITATFKAK